MAEPAEDEDVFVGLEGATAQWVVDRAHEDDLEPGEFLERVLAAVRSVDDDDLAFPTMKDLSAVESHVDRLEADVTEMVEDVRERVIQVKREADGKAPAEHTHPELRNSMEQLSREVQGLGEELDELDDRLVAGFENYEEILAYLTDTSDDLNRKLGQLAAALIDLRDQVGEAARAEGRRAALTRLAAAANQHGVETAKCQECDGSVDISLLTEPQCPHCQATFSELEPKRGFFRSSVLQTGTVPALESARETPAAETDLAAIVDSAEEAPEDIRTTGAPSTPADEPEDEVGTEPAADATADGTDLEEPDEVGAEPAEAEAEATAEQAEPDLEAPEGPRGEAGPPVADAKTDGTGDLQSIDGISPEYADRLRSVGIVSLPALAMADPEELGDAIDVHAWTVADWVEAAEARSELS